MHSLSELVDIFKCCIFNWGALTSIIPAFAIAGAIIAFVPSAYIGRYLGAGSKRYIAYPAAAIAGAILPACSCNIVPLFASILKCGSGIGPAFTFLYAGPAINLISLVLTFKVIGPVLGVWRVIGVLLISILLGLIMEFLFSGRKKAASIAQGAQNPMNPEAAKIEKTRLLLLFGLLFSILITGSSLVTPAGSYPLDKTQEFLNLGIFSGLVVLLISLVITRFKKIELLDWAKQTFKLIKTIVPLFIFSILIIGLIAKYIDIRWIHNLFSAQKDALGNRLFLPSLRSTFYGTIFGELMYFPILSEIAFTKAFLKLGMDVGPALAILLAGAGTSLPGFILISRFVSWKKVVVYFLVSVVLEVTFATSVSMTIGDYVCACLNLK
ncbi:MAG: permease [Candidatus Omnitrophica bacterium]|nr:permease [Candidatus Omnitrophota bacterium]